MPLLFFSFLFFFIWGGGVREIKLSEKPKFDVNVTIYHFREEEQVSLFGFGFLR